MKISHIAIWCKDLELMKSFYEKYFECISGRKYLNRTKMFESYFITFETGCRLELMRKPNIAEIPLSTNVQHLGYIHMALNAGSRDKVDMLTSQLRHDGYVIAGEPRITGDGYYESVVLDPEGNIIEICDH